MDSLVQYSFVGLVSGINRRPVPPPVERRRTSYASEQGPEAPSLLRLPINDLDRDNEWCLFHSASFHLREDQLQRAREANSGQHWRLQSRTGFIGTAPSSCGSHLDRDAPSLHRLSMYERDYECCLLVNFLRQLQQAQEVNGDQCRRLRSHASTGGAPSSYASVLNPGVPSLLGLPIRDLDRDEWGLFRSVFFQQRECQLTFV
ncbi:hypothetical protein HPB51_023321 [Rhipicephalus microplus]|uniref:Uncharacterized protein n=1 Tax=Rhipicephalus microplus TaxID=6941 RepID=A0A9J6EJV9_RHIMP|nr:hypothetical protein HPB51_023321 [Rhipicephalus microplus]